MINFKAWDLAHPFKGMAKKYESKYYDLKAIN